jgi:hypothetical protein
MAVTYCVAFSITLKIMHFTFVVSYDCQIKELSFPQTIFIDLTL